MITPAQENARMLASILGIGEDAAIERLNRTVMITHSATATDALLSQETMELLERTVSVAYDDPSTSQLELIIGGASPRTDLPKLYAAIDHEGVSIDHMPPNRGMTAPHPLLVAIGACSVAAATLRALIDDPALPSVGYPLHIAFRELGLSAEVLKAPVVLSEAVLVGAGAVAHGFLRALRHISPQGSLWIVDPKLVGPGNANRCLYLHDEDVDRPKAEVLASRAAPDLPGLELRTHMAEFSAFTKTQGPSPLVFVTVDSRRARRSIQKDVPGVVLDASTTDVRAVVVHSHRQPTKDACLACIYRHVSDEHARERSIAEGLGIDLSAVMQGFITPDIAVQICQSHPQLDAAVITGKAFDSLFKQLCAAQALRTLEGRQVLAPFAFVSSLAGALLVVELLRQLTNTATTNYWTVDPWSAPFGRLRRLRPRLSGCEFCSRPESEMAVQTLWNKQ